MKQYKWIWLILIVIGAIMGFSSVALLLANRLTSSISQIWTDPPGDAAGDGVYDITSGTMTYFNPTAFVDIVQVSLNVPQQDILQVGLQVAEPIPLSSQDRFCFDFYFDTNDDGLWDTIVFSTHGSYTYDSYPTKPPNTAGVIDIDTDTLLGDAQLSVSGQSLTITLDHSLVNYSTNLLMVVSHYLPSDLADEALACSDGWIHPGFAGRMIGVCSHFVVQP